MMPQLSQPHETIQQRPDRGAGGLAVIQRQGSDSLGEPFHVKVVVASVVVNGRALNNNLVALLVGQAVERMLRIIPAAQRSGTPGAVVSADGEGDAHGRL